MGMCNTDYRPTDRTTALLALLQSIALEETALARLLNAEAEKLERAICLATNMNELIAINDSVLTTIQAINNLEDALREKAIAILEQLNCIR